MGKNRINPDTNTDAKSRLSRRELCVVALIVIAAFAIRLCALAQLSGTPYLDHLVIDARAYDAWATRLASGDWIGSEAFYQSPVYPYCLGVLYAVFGRSLLLPRLIQIALGSLTCALVYLIARRCFSRSVAVGAGIAAALYRPFIFQEVMILKSALVIFLVCALLLLLLRAADRGRLRTWYLPGIVMGIALLDRGQLWLFVPCVLAWIVAGPRQGVRRRMAFAASFLAGMATVITIVTIRNYAVARDFVPTTGGGGLNFYEGNNPRASGIHTPAPLVRTIPEYELDDSRRFAEKSLGRKLKVSEVSNFYFKLGLRFIKDHPRRFARLMMKKFAVFWNKCEVPDNYNQEFMLAYIPVLKVPLLSFGIIAPLGIAGMLFGRGGRRETALLYLFGFSYMTGVILFYVTSRYRLPVVIVLCVFVSAGVLSAWKNLREGRKLKVAAYAIVIACAAAAVNARMFPRHFGFAREYCFLGNFHMEDGQYDEAVRLLETAHELDPREPAILFNLGRAERLRGNFDAARRHLEAVLRKDPSFTMAEDELRLLSAQAATKYIQAGKLEDARRELAALLQKDPNNLDVLNDLGVVLINLGRHAEAIEVLERGRKTAKDNCRILNNLGLAYAMAGRRDLAKQTWEVSLSLNPNQPAVKKKMDALEKGKFPSRR